MIESFQQPVASLFNSTADNPSKTLRLPSSMVAGIVPVFLLLALLVNSLEPAAPEVFPTPPFPHTLILGILSLWVSVMAAVGYVGTGQANLLFLGGATLILGAGNWALAFFGGKSHSLDAGAVYSAFAIFSAIFHMGAAFTPRLVPFVPEIARTRGSFAKAIFFLIALYFALAICVGIYLLANLVIPIPSLCYSSSSCLQIQQSVLSTAAVLYAVSAFAIWRISLDTASKLPGWYAPSLALSAIGFWIFGRSFLLGTVGAYLGAFCLVIGVVLTFRRQVSPPDPLEESQARFAASIREHFHSFIESMPSPTIICDDLGNILVWNSRAQAELGYSQSEAIGARCLDLFVGEASKAVFDRALINLFESETARAQGDKQQIQVRSRVGRYFSADLSLGATKNSDRRFAMIILRDLTGNEELVAALDRQKAESAKSAAELSALARELKGLTDWLSDNLKDAVLSIDQSAFILQEDYADKLEPDARNLLVRIGANTQRAVNMIDQMVTFARVEYLPFNKESIDTALLVNSVLEELVQDHSGRNVQVTVDELPACSADPRLLKQAFEILVSNAFKFTRSKDPAKIHISALRSNGSPASFCVKDNGTGFSMQQADRLFCLFQKLHPGDEFEGNGIGLATLRRIIRRHGGRVWAEGEPDRGARFYFTLDGSTVAH